MTTTTTISDDDLQLIQKQARHFTILDLKKRALLEKQKGNTQHAISYLKQAKQIEQEEQAQQADDDTDDDSPSYSSTLSFFWKKVALLCKQAGDISKAKQALLHAKELEKQELENENGAENTTEAVIADVATPTPLSTSASASAPTNVAKTKDTVPLPPPPPSYENIMNTTDMMNLPPPPPLPPPPSYENIIQKNSTSTSSTSDIEQRKQQQQQKNMARRKQLLQEQEEIEHNSSSLSASNRDNNRKAATPVTVPVPTSIAATTTATAAAVTMVDDDDVVVVAISDNMDHDHDHEHDHGMMSFTDAEMMDEEMMTDFVELGDVESIPSQAEYAAKVLEYKKRALQWKQEGNIPQATQQLRTAKQFEKVAAAVLKSMTTTTIGTTHDNNNEHGGDWMESLNSEENELLGELFESNSHSHSHSHSHSNHTSNTNNNNVNHSEGGVGGESFEATSSSTERLTIEEFEEMEDDNDVIELVQMMGPNALPSVDELTISITRHKQKALKYKQEGNLEVAKQELLKSKKSKVQAMRVAEIYRKLELIRNKDGNNVGADVGDDDIPVDMDTLEALMESGGSSNKKSAHSTTAMTPAASTTPPPPIIDPWFVKPSIEIKKEVLRLKNEKNVKEATRLLQVYKQKLLKEQQEIEQDKCTKLIAMIQQRLVVCDKQIKVWQYYTWFVGGGESSSSSSSGDESIECDITGLVAGGSDETSTSSGAGVKTHYQQYQQQYHKWIKLQKECQQAITALQKEGSNSVTISPQVMVPFTAAPVATASTVTPTSTTSSSDASKNSKNTIGAADATTTTATTATTAAAVCVDKNLYTLDDDDIVSLVESCTNNATNNSATTSAGDSGSASDSATANSGTNNYLAEDALEVVVMGIYEMKQNEKLQKILSQQQKHQHNVAKVRKAAVAATTVTSSSPPITTANSGTTAGATTIAASTAFPPNLKINAKLQLPIYLDDPSKPVYMDFEPTHSSLSSASAAAAVLPSSASSSSSFNYDFDPTHQLSRQQIVLPRKDPKQERTLLRRMETKTIQLSIFYSHDQTMSPQEKIATAKKEAVAATAAEAVASKKKSWFFGGGGKSTNSRRDSNKSELSSEHHATNNDKDIFLGKVTIEFNQLLSRGCITGDYPIMTNAKSLGGILRVAIRTKAILDPDRYEGVTTLSSSSSLSTSVYKNGLTFTFHNTDKNNDAGDKKTSSVATMKTKSVSSSLSPQSTTPPQTRMTTTAATRTSTTATTKAVGVMQLHETRLLP